MLRAQVAASASLVPTSIVDSAASFLLTMASGGLAKAVYLVSLIISFGGTAVVFLTMCAGRTDPPPPSAFLRPRL